jgi:hypothetical protein
MAAEVNHVYVAVAVVHSNGAYHGNEDCKYFFHLVISVDDNVFS